jgi:hypothetical protein
MGNGAFGAVVVFAGVAVFVQMWGLRLKYHHLAPSR